MAKKRFTPNRRLTKNESEAMVILHIGRRAPKGYREVYGAFHLGKGVWVIPVLPLS